MDSFTSVFGFEYFEIIDPILSLIEVITYLLDLRGCENLISQPFTWGLFGYKELSLTDERLGYGVSSFLFYFAVELD